VELSRARLSPRVLVDHRAELALEERRQVRLAGGDERVELLLHGVARGARIFARQIVPVARAPAAPAPVAGARHAARELPELRLERVVVARPHELPQAILVDEARDLAEALREPVARAQRALRERRHLGEALEDAVDRGSAVERVAAPRRREVAVLGERVDRAPEELPRAVSPVPCAAPGQDAADAGMRVRELALEPAVEERARLVLGRDLEERIDAGLDGPLVQEVGAEGVDRPDARELELRERPVEIRPLVGARRGAVAGALDRRSQAELHLARRLLGEGEGDDPLQLRRARPDESEDPRDERGRLAGSRGGLDEERPVELVADAAARLGVG